MEKKELIELIGMVLDIREGSKNDNPMGKLMSDKVDLLAPALSKLQSEVVTITPNRTNQNVPYADLDAILIKSRPLLDKHKFSVIPQEEDHNGIKYLRTILMHASGQFIASFVALIIDDSGRNKRLTPVQAYGSALSYHKRYSISNLLGITVSKDPDDNDGHAIKEQNQTERKENNKPKPDTPKVVELLSRDEIERIEESLKGHDDIRINILAIFKKERIQDCSKSMYGTIVKFIEAKKLEKRIA